MVAFKKFGDLYNKFGFLQSMKPWYKGITIVWYCLRIFSELASSKFQNIMETLLIIRTKQIIFVAVKMILTQII
jgi:hypothetical protein